MEKYYKGHLCWLKDQGHYDHHDDEDRMLMAFTMIPLIQKDLDVFRESVWNTHTCAERHDSTRWHSKPHVQLSWTVWPRRMWSPSNRRTAGGGSYCIWSPDCSW